MSEEKTTQRPPLKSGFSGSAGSSDTGITLGVFAKHWTPSATKTRLAASIGDLAAAEASRCFLEATLRRLGSPHFAPSSFTLAYSPAEQREAFERLAAEVNGDWFVAPQSAGDLGARMQRYFEAALQATRSALLVGSDSPHLPIDAVDEAIRWLGEPGDGPRLVLGPTEDGGYWLIGARGGLPPIFEAMPWSDPALLEKTLARLADAGWREGTDYRLLPRWYDVDDLDDLERLRRELPGGDASLRRLSEQLNELLGPLPS